MKNFLTHSPQKYGPIGTPLIWMTHSLFHCRPCKQCRASMVQIFRFGICTSCTPVLEFNHWNAEHVCGTKKYSTD